MDVLYHENVFFIKNTRIAQNKALRDRLDVLSRDCNTYWSGGAIYPPEQILNEYTALYVSLPAQIPGMVWSDDFFQSEFFLMNIRAYCIVIEFPQFVEIYNVCTEATSRKQGYAAAIFNTMVQFQTKNVMWLGVVLDNPLFEVVVRLYASFGFRNPLLMKKTPGGKSLFTDDQSFLGLTWIRRSYQSSLPAAELILDEKANKDYSQVVVRQALALREQYMRLENPCIFNFQLPQSILEYFYQSIRNQVIEIGGLLHIDYYSESSIGKLASLTLPLQNVSQGTGEPTYSVSIDTKDATIAMFHTHPNIVNMSEEYFITWPSSVDILSSFEMGLQRKLLLQFVITMEGIYVIAFNGLFINYLNEWYKKTNGKDPMCLSYMKEAIFSHFGAMEPFRIENRSRERFNHLPPGPDRFLLEKEQQNLFINEYFKNIADYSFQDLGKELARLITEKAPSVEVPALLACFADSISNLTDFPLLQCSFRSWNDISHLASFAGQIILPSANCWSLLPIVKNPNFTYIS